MARKYLFLGLWASVFLLLAMFVPKTSTEEVCREFLLNLGWETAGEVREELVTLPKTEDATWAQYLAMQRENGFDMYPYGEKEVLKLVFAVTNHPFGDDVYATVYYADGRVIGGDIMSPALRGFMHGLRLSSF